MKTMRFPLLVALFAVSFASVLRADTPAPASPGKLYVTIETFEPIKFNDYRHGLRQPGDLVMSTLQATAAHSAKLAGLDSEIVVLAEDVPAPVGASVLHLTWTDGNKTVTADLIENGKKHFLGVVSRKEIVDHPERERLLRTVNAAVPPEEHNDITVQTRTEMNLYFALKLTADRRARAAKS